MRRSSRWSGTRHSLESGMRGMHTFDVANDCFVVRESDYMSRRDDIVYADKCGAIAIGDDGEVV